MTDEILQIPQSREAEEAVLGSILIDPEGCKSLDLLPEDFYLGRHQLIFLTYQKMVAAGQQVDLLTIVEELSKSERFSEIGAPYLTRLINQTPTALNAEYYARIVSEKARRRGCVKIANLIANAAFDPESDLDGIVADLAHKLVMSGRPQSGAIPISKFMSRLYDEVEANCANPQEFYGIPTGFVDFDRITGGLQEGEEFILSGEPGLGKSLLACQIGAQMAEKQYPGALFELEMDGIAVVRRLVSGKSAVQTRKMRTGKFVDDDWTKFTWALDNMSQLPIYMSQESNWNTTSLRAELSRLKATHNIRWFIVDYMELMTDLPKESDDNKRSAFISRHLHNICKDLHLAGLVIQSMTKEGMGAPGKTKNHIRGSGQVIYDADQIAFVCKTDNPEMIQITWDKIREGETSERICQLLKKPGNYPAFVNVQRGE